jgi:FkbH-like protein
MWVIESMPWLQASPPDFRQRLKILSGAAGEPIGSDLRRLGNYALEGAHMRSVAHWLAVARRSGWNLAPLVPLRVAVLSNGTTQLVNQAIEASGLRHGLNLETVTLDFGQVAQQALDPQSTLFAARPDVVLIALDHHGFPWRICPGSVDDAQRMAEAAFQFVVETQTALQRHSQATVVVQTVPPPAERLFGSLDRTIAGSWRDLCERFNTLVRRDHASMGSLLFDVAALAEEVGLTRWHDPTNWHAAKLSFSPHVVALYADHLARLLAAVRGLGRRVLVLDLDNTLWGGVVGDDGIDGLRLGQGDAIGEAFVEFQHTAKDLRGRGIVLCVCSKNHERNARLPFEKHPETVLSFEDFAVFIANWDPKPDNLKAIAASLGLATNSMVFFDDNPAEREFVRQTLPDVAVPEVPQDPSLYSRVLLAAGYFESIAFSNEDRSRAEQYSANASREALRMEAGSVDDYLKSLDMHIEFGAFSPETRVRVAQLLNKSNQYNLRTRRYSEVQIESMESDQNVYTLHARLRDRFGDNGLISIVICQKAVTTWFIDTWLMSCRVLARGVEYAVMNEVATAASAAGATLLIGEFVPTERNELVRDHFSRLGFHPAESVDPDCTRWHLDVAGFQPNPVPIRVTRKTSS